MAAFFYALCALAAAFCSTLLLRGYFRTRYRLLFWGGLCFLGLTANNTLLMLDKLVFPDVDLDSDDPEAKVSRRHARISFENGEYAIEDLGSTNGTFVNRGRRLKPGDRQPLKDGDEIIVGKTFLRFRVAK